MGTPSVRTRDVCGVTNIVTRALEGRPYNMGNPTMDIKLKTLSHNPVYAQVRDEIEAQIRTKAVKSGEALPSPIALAQKLSVDKGEIQRAYFELEQSGLVKKEIGKDFLGKPKTVYRVV